MYILQKCSLFLFAVMVSMQFALSQYIPAIWPPPFNFQSNYINESTPFAVEETLINSETISTSLETTTPNFNQLTRGMHSKWNYFLFYRVLLTICRSNRFYILADICALQPLNGNGRFTCFAYFPRYFHNSTSKRCEVFIYGGCGGNENRFDTKEECEQFCLTKIVQKY